MKFKKLKDVKTPHKAYEYDAGIDVFSPSFCAIEAGETKRIPLGIAIEINKDEVAIMSERSSMALNNGLTSIGNIIDAGYRGEISIIMLNSGDEKVYIDTGDKIGQIIICKLGDNSIIEDDNLSEADRSDKGCGSSGK